ncbi:MAG: hypothetical protein PVF83_05955 [Anaerolineales bacterium]|jgi:hypothetical protein
MRFHSLNKKVFTHILLATATLSLMIACKALTGETAPTVEATTPPDLETYRATPIAESPAAGICGKLDSEIVTITIYPDIPDPRCMEVTWEQKLRVVNRRGEVLQVSIGRFEAEIPVDGEYTFDMAVGEYLMPGVHLIQVSPCCSPEILLKTNNP